MDCSIFFYYAGRQNIALAIPLLKEEFGWTEAQLGFISACLFWTYGFSHLLWGRLSDKIGGSLLVTAAGIMEWVAYMFAALQAVVLGAILTLTGGNWKLLFVLVAIIQLIGVKAIWAVKR